VGPMLAQSAATRMLASVLASVLASRYAEGAVYLYVGVNQPQCELLAGMAESRRRPDGQVGLEVCDIMVARTTKTSN
jgi:hypothetical protein